MPRQPFEQNLLDLIRANGLTKADVARRIGVSPSTLTRWSDKGEQRELSAQHLLALSRVLGVDPWVLLGSTFTEPEPPSPSPKRGRPVSPQTMNRVLVDGPVTKPSKG